MFDPHTYYLFLATAVVLVLTPGPDTILILSRSLASGAWAGFMTLLGTQVGNVVHAVLAGIGVSTVILLFPAAFNVLKFAGVAYLVYLAVVTWRASARLDLNANRLDGGGSAARFFVQGLLNNLANPKMIAFFLALFPQFIDSGRGSLAIQSLALGVTLAVMAIAWIGLMVVAAGSVRTVVASNDTFLKFINRLASVTFLGLAMRLAFQENR